MDPKKMFFNSAPLLTLIAVVFSVCVIPTVFVVSRAWGIWQGVPWSYVGDALYYLARIKAVASGHFLLGSPQYLEYSSGVTLSFSISDWLTALPYVLTHSWGFTIIWNIFFWTLAFSVLSYFIFRIFCVDRWTSVLGSLLLLSQTFGLLLKPVSMQVSYSMYAVFLLALGLFILDPTKKTRVASLAVVGALAVYTYTFLGQIAVASLALLLSFFFLVRRWKEVTSLMYVSLGSAVLLGPFGFIFFGALTNGNYSDVLLRYGFVASHIPNPQVYFFGRWMVLALIAWGVVWWYARQHFNDIDWKRMYVGCSLALGILIVLLAPLVVGKDVDSAGHLGRFVFPVLVFNAVFLVATFRRIAVSKLLTQWLPATALLTLMLFSGIGLVQNTYREHIPQISSRDYIATVQEYAPVLNFIDRLPASSVVWADDALTQYIPIMTRQYVLSSPEGGFSLIPLAEIEERYLTSRYPAPPSTLSVPALIEAGPVANFSFVNEREKNNRMRALCRVLARLRIGSINECPPLLTSEEAMGKAHFSALSVKYQTVIFPHINTILDHFHVRYIVRDRIHDIPLDPKSVRGASIYDDGRFIVYERGLSHEYSKN